MRETRVWKSIFRRGPARTNRTRSLAVFGNLFLHFLPVKVREKSLRVRASYYLGSISFLLFIVLAVTGVLLMFYYHPAVPQAYRDMKDLQFVVSNGVFLRNLHRLAAQLMVLAVFWHMFHVFYRGGYKPPHEFNWVVGVVLLIVTLFLSYTGYLLPWDQLAFWAITVGTNIISAMPVMGSTVRFESLGGNISRRRTRCCVSTCFTAWSCRWLPWCLIAVHFWRVQKDGGLTVREEDERKEYKYEAGFSSDARKDPRRVVFITKKTSAKVTGDVGPAASWPIPHLLIREAIVFMVLVIALVERGALLGRAARATRQPASDAQSRQSAVVFPGLQELLHYFPPLVAGIIIPTLVVVGLMVIPYFHVNVQGQAALARNRKRDIVDLSSRVVRAYLSYWLTRAPGPCSCPRNWSAA